MRDKGQNAFPHYFVSAIIFIYMYTHTHIYIYINKIKQKLFYQQHLTNLNVSDLVFLFDNLDLIKEYSSYDIVQALLTVLAESKDIDASLDELQLLKFSIRQEVQYTESISTLFRRNSFASRSVATASKIFGSKSFLRKCWPETVWQNNN